MTGQIFIWWLAAQGFGLAGLPLAQFLFRALPDRGYAFAKAIGLLLAGYLAWLVAMLGLAPFGVPLIVVSALVVGGVGLLVNRRPRAKDQEPRTEDNNDAAKRFSVLGSRFLLGWLREHWRTVVAYEALFLLALVFLALLRSYNPDPWGTERPMDFALFNAIRRSASFPPHDPWLSGYSINYYYFGYMLMAVVALVSGLEPAVAFNLSLALIFALTGLGVAGVVHNLIALTKNLSTTDDRRPTTDDQQLDSRHGDTETRRYGADQSPGLPVSRSPGLFGGRWSVVGGHVAAILLAVVLVLLAGNQGGALELITGTNMAVALNGQELWRAVANGLGPRQPIALDSPFMGDYFEGTSIITPTDMVERFDWWQPSRAMWDTYTADGLTTRHYTITEFPFFSFWLGDMHPHVMALPFGLLALALALQTTARPAAPAFAMGRRGWLELALTGIVLGSLYAINSWDFPTYLLLFLGALLLLHIRLGSPAPESAEQLDAAREPESVGLESEVEPAPQVLGFAHQPSRLKPPGTPAHPLARSPLQQVWWRHYLGQVAMVVAASLVMLAPFHLTFRSLVGGKQPLIDLPILATITRTLGFVIHSRTPLHSFLIIFGLFLLPLVAYVIAQGRISGAKETPGRLLALSPNLLIWQNALPWVALVALALGQLVRFPLLALLPLAVYAGLLAIERARRPAAALALWAFALICLVCFGTDIVYIRDVFEGNLARLNTIFKFYYQTWLIWGVLAGYALWWLATRRPTTDDRQRSYAIRNTQYAIRWLGAGLFAGLFGLLLAGALVYPWLTAGRTFREGQRVGLMGKTPRQETPEGATAIEWLRTNAPNSAVILEAVGGAYNGEGFGGVSAATGMATVLGWPGHEDQWRGGDPSARAQIGPREQDVKTIYSTLNADEAQALLEKYKVDYVYVGQLERSAFAPESLAKFDQIGSPVFREGDVTIYQVSDR
jgi:YYY domain-containing protein